MSALPNDIAAATREAIIERYENTAVRDALTGARDGSLTPGEGFFDLLGDAKTIVDERGLVLAGDPRFSVSVAALVWSDPSLATPAVRLVDSEQSVDARLCCSRIELDLEEEVTSFELFYAGDVDMTPPPTGPAPVRIARAAAGSADGSSWDNAAPLSALNTMIGKAALTGAEVWVRADAGTYALPTSTMTISRGGTATRAVTVRGVDADGNSMKAVFVGDRANPWTMGSPGGVAEHFWLNAGASNLVFKSIEFRNAGTCIRLRQPNSNLTFEDIDGNNIRRLIQNNASSGQTASINGLTIRRCNGNGYSKQFVIVRYDSANVLIEDCHADAQKQDGDNFACGFQIDDTAHDVVFRRCISENNYNNNGSAYWNSDGFSGERGNYRLTLEDCVARYNTDGGYDFKSQITLTRCLGVENKRNFRMWGDAYLVQCVGQRPVRNGSGSIGQVYAYANSRVRVASCTFTDDTTGTNPFHIFATGFLAVDQATINATSHKGSKLFDDEGNADAPSVVWNHADTVAPSITSATQQTAVENQPKDYLLTLSEPGTLEISGPDAGKFARSGRTISMRAQDYDVANGPAADGSKVLKIIVVARDANGNGSAPTPFQVEIQDAADDPILPAEAFAYSGANGAWFDLSDTSTLWADVAMTVPAIVGGSVAVVQDKSGFGNHLVQPDVDRQAVFRMDGFYPCLEFNGASTFYTMGPAGGFRYPQFTAFAGLRRARDDSEDLSTAIFFGRRGTATTSSSNGTFWLGVRGGASATFRMTSPSGTSDGVGGTVDRRLMLSFRSTDAVVRSNAVPVVDATDTAANTYPLATEQPLVGARYDGNGYLGFIDGRLYSLAVLNQACADDVRFRIERQLAQSAGVIL